MKIIQKNETGTSMNFDVPIYYVALRKSVCFAAYISVHIISLILNFLKHMYELGSDS